MAPYRIPMHPILNAGAPEAVSFTWCNQPLMARPGEMIASALFAHGIRIFGYHAKDAAPQGIFCANGQCAQCLVLADGKPVKACMTPATPGLRVLPIEGLPTLPDVPASLAGGEVETVRTPVLILGGGPAGMSAAIELGEQGVPCLLLDDKARLGGKLVLQTHRFFGSVEAVYAGTRGVDIATKLTGLVESRSEVTVWPASTALAVFSDRKVGVLRKREHGNSDYVLVEPEVLLVATGARERSLIFPGNTLPGVYGAGAFQTLVNRDLVRAANRLFVVGGGNVGLIAGYHALQAGIEVVGLVEALPDCGGYKVHRDKLQRLGVPIYTSHTVLSANGSAQVASITIAEVDVAFQPVPGTARTYPCDTVLIAVGLDPVDEFTHQARAYGMTVFDAGDAQAIAEASAAMFTGKIAGRQAAHALGADVETPDSWHITAEILKSHPGATVERQPPERDVGVFPVFHCTQEIPCNPCTAVCPRHLIRIPGDDIRHLPVFVGGTESKDCTGCERCVTVCPGLAITLVDTRRNPEEPVISIPYEFAPESLAPGDLVTVLDVEGRVLAEAPVQEVHATHRADHTAIVRLSVPKALAVRIAGLRLPGERAYLPLADGLEQLEDDAIVCRCERVTAGEIRAAIRAGCRDVNELKTLTRVAMGACGGKTCSALIDRLFRDEGIPAAEVTAGTRRPLFVEVPLAVFAKAGKSEEPA
jgi:sarcosine oxidase, subunit alpha